jgi:hypothetical protein
MPHGLPCPGRARRCAMHHRAKLSLLHTHPVPPAFLPVPRRDCVLATRMQSDAESLSEIFPQQSGTIDLMPQMEVLNDSARL